MPNWKIHLEVGNIISQKLKLSNKEKELFLLGNILPDLNNCFIVKNIKIKYSHSYTHYSDLEQRKSYISFKNKYKKEINNPLVFGYYMHLYTDYIWNKDFYTNFKDDTLNKDEKRKLKQNDFKKYNYKYINNKIDFKYIDNDLKNLKIIDRVKLEKEDLNLVKDFLINQKEEKKEYKFYTEKKLDELLNKTINNVYKEIEYYTNKV